MTAQIKEGILVENFVAPYLCKHLVDAGLCLHVPYHWKINDGLAVIATNAFDPDEYYSAAEDILNLIYPPEAILPAYSIKNIEKILPAGYLLSLTEQMIYEVSLSSLYSLPHCVAGRMPDAFAMMLLQCIKSRVVDLHKINLIMKTK